MKRVLYRSQVGVGGKKPGASKRALTSEITIATLRVPEARIGTCTRRVCALGFCRNINFPCPQRRIVTHRLVVYIRYPDNINQFLLNELNRCVGVARNAMVASALALLPLLVANPGVGLAGVLNVGARAFFACAATIPGYALIRGQVTIFVGYRREASDWVAVRRSKKRSRLQKSYR